MEEGDISCNFAFIINERIENQKYENEENKTNENVDYTPKMVERNAN